ncbi:MAG: glycosyltransferase family 4 protein [Nitrospirae bacterium]|nr:glycosyltransferase family 4 protein [Nitrospirota bacterium]
MADRKLKILHILVGTAFGGATVMVRLLSQYQMRQGHEVFVMANDVPGARDEFRKHGITLLNDRGIRGHIHPLTDIFHLFYWIAVIKKHDFDIVHTQTVKAGFIGRLAARIAGTRHILHSCHGYRLEGRFRSPIVERIYISIERFLSSLTDIIIVQSRADRATALKRRIAPEEKLRIVYNGIDVSGYEEQDDAEQRMSFRNEIGADEDQVVIGTVGRLDRAKAHEYLIDAAELVLKNNGPGVRFVFVGDGPERDSLTERIEKKGLSRYFLFLNHRKDIPRIMRGIDMHVLPSIREGFPIALLEAMAAGVPSVTTNVGGSAEAVEEGVTGFVVPPGDPEGLAEAIMKLVDNRTLMTEMGRNGRSRIMNNFTAEIMGKKIMDICSSRMTDNAGLIGERNIL